MLDFEKRYKLVIADARKLGDDPSVDRIAELREELERLEQDLADATRDLAPARREALREIGHHARSLLTAAADRARRVRQEKVARRAREIHAALHPTVLGPESSPTEAVRDNDRGTWWEVDGWGRTTGPDRGRDR
ncbi:hypothetical protein [Nocardia takedensis]|uniref:hypothetical protein n=1 Tax=Nocardia takedensis TaxID=259390 RepID=UPI0002FD7B30|nr:hypothetical protein [Nocardia takedensis]